MENILEIALKAICVVTLIFSATLTMLMIIRTIKEIKEDKKYYENRNAYLKQVYENLDKELKRHLNELGEKYDNERQDSEQTSNKE